MGAATCPPCEVNAGGPLRPYAHGVSLWCGGIAPPLLAGVSQRLRVAVGMRYQPHPCSPATLASWSGRAAASASGRGRWPGATAHPPQAWVLTYLCYACSGARGICHEHHIYHSHILPGPGAQRLAGGAGGQVAPGGGSGAPSPSADSIVPGNASGGMAGIAYKPLTVDVHETGFVAKVAQENQFGPWYTLATKNASSLAHPGGLPIRKRSTATAMCSLL